MSPSASAPSPSPTVVTTLARCALPLVAIVVVTTWPWQFQTHAHWRAVEWVPFTYYHRPGEWLANIVLFAPLGLAYGWGASTRRRLLQAVVVGLACSVAVELTQVFIHGRSPTVADVIANTIGAWAGARWAGARSARASADRSASAPSLQAPSPR